MPLHQYHGPRNVSASVLKSSVKRITYAPKCSTSCRKVLFSLACCSKRFTLSADLDLPEGFGMHVRYRATGGTYLDDDNTVSLDGASTLDMRLRRTIGGQLVFVDVFNITDTRYDEYGFTLTGFTGETVPYVYPEAPRAVRVGVTASF